MRDILLKEIKLSSSPLAFLFIAFGFMFLVPGYPILCGAFFVTLGLFQSFQTAREANDIVFSALLPIAKSDVVKGKYQFSMMIELAGFLIMAILTVVRMTVFSDAEVYRENALMNANPFFLGMALVVFGVFNMAFIGGFFRTAYKLSPFVTYCFVVFAVIALAEAAHHFPGMDALNAFGFDNIILQIVLMLAGAVIYLVLTYVSYRGACRNFETIDL